MGLQPSRMFCGFSAIVCTIIALVLFILAGSDWYYRYVWEHSYKPMLNQPISFAEGFSFTSSFTVAYAQDYSVEIVCPVSHPPRQDWGDVFDALSRQLPIKCTITCDGTTVAEGDSPGEKRMSFSPREDNTREIAAFPGMPGKRYEVFFRTVSEIPVRPHAVYPERPLVQWKESQQALEGTKPRVWIRPQSALNNPSFPQAATFWVNAATAWVIAGMAILFAVLRWRIGRSGLSAQAIPVANPTADPSTRWKLRIAIPALAVCGCLMLWGTLWIAGFIHHHQQLPLEIILPVWAILAGICLLLSLVFSVVSLVRRDWFGVAGLLVVILAAVFVVALIKGLSTGEI